jgi:hypothetical protein
MNIDQASAFLVGSILIGLAICVLSVVILVVNNLFSRFWKTIHWSKYEWLQTGRFVDSEDSTPPRQAPEFDSKITKKKPPVV